jgi:hypothetical protein
LAHEAACQHWPKSCSSSHGRERVRGERLRSGSGKGREIFRVASFVEARQESVTLPPLPYRTKRTSSSAADKLALLCPPPTKHLFGCRSSKAYPYFFFLRVRPRPISSASTLVPSRHCCAWRPASPTAPEISVFCPSRMAFSRSKNAWVTSKPPPSDGCAASCELTEEKGGPKALPSAPEAHYLCHPRLASAESWP